ncbi:udk [Ecytonucleospora hepatopenaei]|uniref:Udk n=1 Tax=Ecytonucleospora hepatopenaei TaxID=646526 RepID=A0A1W0E7K8_9MICR|nr:udk [Ecytonucleospora hepatopenaei]
MNRKPITFIAIQGCSCAGKSVFSDFLYRNLRKSVSVDFLRLDDFYAGTEFDYRDEKAATYDFDNPAALNWHKIKSVVTQYINGDKEICGSQYDFSSQKRKDIFYKNTFPEVILVEGIYAFNLFNTQEFDCDLLDPFKQPLEHSGNFVKENDFLKKVILENNCKVIKVELKLEKEKMKTIRMRRDMGARYADSSVKFRDMLEKRFETLIWPATEKWVLSKNNFADILIENGTFNMKKCKEVGENIFKMFDEKIDSVIEREEMLFDKMLNLSDLNIL